LHTNPEPEDITEGVTGAQAPEGEEHLAGLLQLPPQAWFRSPNFWVALQAGSCPEMLPNPDIGLKTPDSIPSVPLQGFGHHLLWLPAALQQEKTLQDMEMGRAGACCPVKQQRTCKPFQGWVPDSTGITRWPVYYKQ